MKHEIILKLHKNFDHYTQSTEGGIEFWYARDLQMLPGHDQWKNFEKVIEKAKIVIKNMGLITKNHFTDVSKMVPISSLGNREIYDISLTCYVCYIIVQNGDSKKDEIVFAMGYFAVQTRKQELVVKRIEELERLHFREKLTNSEMKKKLNIPEKRPLADFLPAITIKAKDFANEITNFTLKKNIEIKDETEITKEHLKNNTDTRKLLVKKGILSEDLPKEEGVKKIARRIKSKDKKLLGRYTIFT